ncbi:hypothetical protein RJ640_008678 [Escallonia rubra]|uniref:LanC-like protein GCL2 n=1 Tax=Escallonia rubra TaxID=112253 RepID=A0AA88RMQ9_9ASTE|nr:hypothetical protein RJ640_008678 [Escallonia rubra]
MANRYFPNLMPDFIAETPQPPPTTAAEEEIAAPGTQEQWIQDYTPYTGVLGTAFLLLKAYQVSNNKNDLNLAAEIVKDCDTASSHSSFNWVLMDCMGSRDVTFICGRAGVCAIGAVIAKHTGDNQMLNYYLAQFKKIKLSKDLPEELLYGRAGFLWACLFLNKHFGEGTIATSYTDAVVDEIINNGRKLGVKRRCPLMFEMYGEKYWGAAHGLAGIIRVLLEYDLKPDQSEDVKGTLKYMIKNRFPSGNYPASEEDRGDALVHWCHGAPGVALTLVKAAEVYRERELLEAAIDAAEVVWNRGLLKRVGICHGISGNAYVFLSLYRLTGNMEFLYRAKAFACFLLDRGHKLIAEGQMHAGDNPYSLFEGVGGMAYLFLDLVEPVNARFPAYEL